MTDPVVSILIPAYRADQTLRRCLGGLLSGENAGVPVQILVESDDGSAYAEAAALSPLVQVAVTGQVASGVGAARSRALARATAPFVTYVDADDEVAADYLPQLLKAAQGRAALACTEVLQAGQMMARFGTPGQAMDFAGLSRHGASFRGVFARVSCPNFVNDLAQDILHLAEVMLRAGPLPVADTAYHLHLAEGSVTAAGDFSARVEAAYLRHVERLAQGYPSHPDLAKAQALFHAKRALNARYVAEAAPGESYYGFIARMGV